MTEIRDKRHWTHQDFKQRMTIQEWSTILLHYEDTVVFKGCVTRLKARALGSGIVEVYKSHKVSEEVIL